MSFGIHSTPNSTDRTPIASLYWYAEMQAGQSPMLDKNEVLQRSTSTRTQFQSSVSPRNIFSVSARQYDREQLFLRLEYLLIILELPIEEEFV